VAYNETLRNTLTRVLEAMGMEVVGIPHTSAISDITADILILCPASQYEEGHSIAMHDEPRDGDDLQTAWKALCTGLKSRPDLKSIVLAPLTQLAQASEFRKLPGCSLTSRPVRVRVLRDTIMQTLLLEDGGSTAMEDALSFQQSETAKTADSALFPYEMEGTLILVAIVDAAQRMVLKAMLTRETHQCAVCNSMKDLASQLKQRQKKSQGWNYDVLFVEYSSANDGKEYADLSIVETIRRLEAMEDLGEVQDRQHKLLIVGLVAEGATQDKEACLKAGMDTCIEMPIHRQAVADAMHTFSKVLSIVPLCST
jgi:CheY-like chemotaxis protein